MLLATIAVAALLGATASYPLLSWGARLDRRRVAAIGDRYLPWLAALLLPIAWVILANRMLFWLDQLGPVAIYVALAAAGVSRRTGLRPWRAALYGATVVILLGVLAGLDPGSPADDTCG
jgi:hypothetical protein